MNDVTGREIHIGDRIVYPARRDGQKRQIHMAKGTVVLLGDRFKRGTKDPVPVIRIRPDEPSKRPDGLVYVESPENTFILSTKEQIELEWAAENMVGVLQGTDTISERVAHAREQLERALKAMPK